MDANTPCKYDWDDIVVGRLDVNHSEKFFRFKHVKHEKLDENIQSRRELYGFVIDNDKENECKIELNCQEPKQQHQPTLKQEKSVENGDHSQNEINYEGNRAADEHKTEKARLPNILGERNLATKQLAQPNIKDNKVPSVYTYNEIYEKRRQEMIQRLQKEEREKRIFHSKPAPKFKNSHDCKIMEKPMENKNTTVPVTPMVLKKSREMDEKRKKKLEEYEKKMRPPTFTSQDPQVLYEEPYKPKKQNHVVELKPFSLHVEKRLEERKAFNEKVKRTFEEKKKQVSEEEEEKMRRDKELVKELRKMTAFKARPNPFK